MRKKKRAEESGGGWEIVFTSLSIILVAFFCMLNSYSDMEKGRMIEIVRSFKGALTILPGGLSPDLGVELVLPSPDKFSQGQVAIGNEYRKAIESLKQQLEEAGAGGGVSVEPEREGLRITFSNTLLFDTGKAELKNPSQKFVDIVANTIKKSRVKAVITGHTDNVPIHTELYQSNWELSVMRAVNLLRYMVNEFRIPLDRIEARGCGEFRPKNGNDTPEDRARNRRVEIILQPMEKDSGQEIK